MGQRLSRAARIVVLVAVCAAAARPAAAGERAEIVLVGELDRARPIGGAIADLLAADALEVFWSYRPGVDPDEILRPLASGAGAPAARIWVDVAQPSRVHVYLADVSATRFAARSVPVDTFDVATEETVAQIVRSSLHALLDARVPALSRREMKSAVALRVRADNATPAPPAPGGTALEARVAWLGSSPVADAPVAQAAWLTVGVLGRGPGPRLGLWGSAGYGFGRAVEDRARATGARLSSWGVRAGVGADLPLPSRLRARLGIGGGLDRLHVVPRSSTLAAGPASDATLGLLRATLGLQVPVWKRLSATLLVHAELAPRLRLTVVDDAGPAVVSSSRNAYPALEAGLAWEL